MPRGNAKTGVIVAVGAATGVALLAAGSIMLIAAVLFDDLVKGERASRESSL